MREFWSVIVLLFFSFSPPRTRFLDLIYKYKECVFVMDFGRAVSAWMCRFFFLCTRKKKKHHFVVVVFVVIGLLFFLLSSSSPPSSLASERQKLSPGDPAVHLA